MKKIYQIPEMKVVKIQTQQIIAASLGYGDDVTTASGAESRRFGGVWDDDDDE